MTWPLGFESGNPTDVMFMEVSCLLTLILSYSLAACSRYAHYAVCCSSWDEFVRDDVCALMLYLLVE